ncbi:MAG TPA: M42 family metallopeptidase [Patescibacteria group bacterium]|nr:M42 family metallopeptidase [Patescibacteria group bacterium]
MINLEYTLEMLQMICTTPSPTGMTTEVMKMIEVEFNKLDMEVSYNNKGGLITYYKGKNHKAIKAIAAHADTLGAMVKEIKGDGKLAITTVGDYIPQSIECENCTIHTAEGKTYSGTFYTTKPSIHVYKDAGTHERTIEGLEVVIDEKVFSVKDVGDLGIDVGDFISFDSRFRITESGFIKTRHLDDKASVAIILGVCKYMKENDIIPENDIQIFFTSHEEVGHGASHGIDDSVSELLCVDMGALGMGQNSDEYTVSICAKDGSGPYDYELRSRLVQLAKEIDAEYKVGIYPFYSSDGSAAQRAGRNLKVGLIGPGVYASHAYERTHKDSIINTAKLLIAYMQQ